MSEERTENRERELQANREDSGRRKDAGEGKRTAGGKGKKRSWKEICPYCEDDIRIVARG